MFIYLCITLITLIVYYNLKRHYSFYRHFNKFPGPKGWPIIKNGLEFGRSPTDFLSTLMKYWHEYGQQNYRIELGLNPFLVISEPRDLEIILSSFKNLGKMKGYDYYRPWVGDGLIMSSGAKWHAHRKIIAPTFNIKNLSAFLTVMNEHADHFIDVLGKQVNQTINIHELFDLTCLDTISETIMGVKINALDEKENSKFAKSFHVMGEVNMGRLFSPWKDSEFIFKLCADYLRQLNGINIIHTLINDVIKDRKEYNKSLKNAHKNGISNGFTNNEDDLEFKPKKKNQAFLDTLFTVTKNDNPLNDQEIADEVGNFIFAGHETTSACLAYSFYMLSIHPEIQDKVYAEQKEYFGDNMSSNLSYQDVQNLTYLDMFVKEVTRMYPSVPFIGRYVDESFDMNGKFVPAGTNLLLLVLATGRNPKYYKNPDQFDPERFANDDDVDKYAHIPFSSGPRDCVGRKFALLEIKTYISKMVRNFVIEPSDDKNYKPQLMAISTLQSANGVQIKLKCRS